MQREVVDGAPELAEYYSTIDGEYYRIELHAVNLRHLKRLVKSIDLVEFEGGLDKAKNVLFLKRTLGRTPHADRLEQAIADYDSIYGGEHV